MLRIFRRRSAPRPVLYKPLTWEDTTRNDPRSNDKAVTCSTLGSILGPLIERIEKLDKRVGELEKFAELIGEGLSKVYPDGFPSPLPSPSPSSSPLCTPSPPPSFEAEPREDLIDLDRVLEDLEATAAHFNELSARFESRFCELIKVFFRANT